MLKSGWGISRTVYWYNSIPWRILKSGALVILGFFSLSGGNLVLSYKPEWTFLNYVVAYGFLLIIYGPIHHLIVIPLSLKLVHTSWGQNFRVNKRIPFWTLIIFFVVVIYLGMYPVSVMKFEFKALNLTQTPDINPKVSCYRKRSSMGESDEIICRVPDKEGIAYVEVENNGSIVLTDRSPPFKFTISVGDLEEVVGTKNFHVVIRDQNGSMIRRYVRSISLIEEKTDTPTNMNK